MSEVLEGKVKWFSIPKGYGWIETDDHGDFYFHDSGIIQDGSPPLRSFEAVTFTVVLSPRGIRAINVQRKQISNRKDPNNGNERV